MAERIARAAGEATPRRSRLLWVGLPVFAVFAVFGVVVWLGYQENARVPTGEPPLIRAIAAPYKLAPDDPGGRQVADQGEINQLLRDEPRPALPERVLPLPEEPRAPIVRAAPVAPSEPPAAETTADAPATGSSPAQGAGAPRDATQEAEAALARLLADVGPSSSEQQPAAVAQPAAPAQDATVAVPETRPAAPPTTTAPTTVLRDPPPAAAPADVPSREADAALTRLLAEVAGVPVEDASEPPPAPVSPPPGTVAAIAPADRASAQTSGYRVQLAAVREQEDARRAWASLVERLGPLVADHEPVYERAETVNGVFYRVQLGPFASAQVADRLCAEVQRRNASCFVVGP